MDKRRKKTTTKNKGSESWRTPNLPGSIQEVGKTEVIIRKQVYVLLMKREK